MYSFLFVRLGITSRGPDRTFQGAVSGPRAVVCPSLVYTMKWKRKKKKMKKKMKKKKKKKKKQKQT